MNDRITYNNGGISGQVYQGYAEGWSYGVWPKAVGSLL